MALGATWAAKLLSNLELGQGRSREPRPVGARGGGSEARLGSPHGQCQPPPAPGETSETSGHWLGSVTCVSKNRFPLSVMMLTAYQCH